MRRVVTNYILTDFVEATLAQMKPAQREELSALLKTGADHTINTVFKRAMKESLIVDWAVQQGLGADRDRRHPHHRRPRWLGRESLKAAVPVMKTWPYAHLKTESVKASAVEESSREYLRQRFDELSKDEYLAIMDGVDRCIHPEPGYRTPGPTLLIAGEHDKTGNIRKSMAAWAKREPGAEYHVIDGAGHCANLDRPAQVNTLITAFLARHVPHPGRADVRG